MLEVSHLSKTYTSGFLGNKRVDAVKDVSFKVNSGEIFGPVSYTHLDHRPGHGRRFLLEYVSAQI